MKLSIIVPVYNGICNGLLETIDSIRCQTFHAFELIIVDDNSTDNSTGILQTNLKNVNFPVKFLTHQENTGLSKSWDDGIAVANGELIL